MSKQGTYRDIARLHGVSKDAISRHISEGHIAERLARARDEEEAVQADELMRHLKALQGKTVNLLVQAEAAGDLRTALAAIAQARANIEVLGKLAGQLDERPVVLLTLHPEWVQLRGVIVAALDAHPQARAEVVRAIEGVTNGAP